MGLFLLVGLFCLLAVIGFFATGRPFAFAFGGIVFLIALAFVVIIGFVIYEISQSSSTHTTQQTSASQYALPVQTSQTQTGATTQYPSGKCVTEAGVLICDLSYQSSDEAGNTRTVTMQGNEIICHDMTTGLNADIKGDTGTISTDPTFCASDYGGVYIDPTINVAKYYGSVQTSGQDFAVPSTEYACLWTYTGGSAAVPYIQAGSYIGPDTSYDQVHAFCKSASGPLDIFTASQ